MNLLPQKPELCFQIIDILKKEKYTIQCADAKAKSELEKATQTCAANSEASLSVEEQLRREKDARLKLQEKNAELLKRIKELEKTLDDETNLRKSLQEQLKGKS